MTASPPSPRTQPFQLRPLPPPLPTRPPPAPATVGYIRAHSLPLFGFGFFQDSFKALLCFPVLGF